MTRTTPKPVRAAVLLALAAVLGGCASFSPDGGFGTAQQAAQQHLGKDLRWARSDADRDAIDARVADLLARPLDADAAVQIALLNNRGLQAGFFELSIGESELVMAGRLPNPGFSFGRSTQGDEREIERGLHFNLARLLVLPWAKDLESRRFDALRQQVALDVLALAAEARKAWVNAVAAEASVRYTRQVMQAAEAGAELARRMQQVGNFSKLQRAREQAFYADAALNVARAEGHRVATRERLTRLLGLWGTQTGFTLPERLPELPKTADELPDIERTAMAQRLDVQAAKAAAEQTAGNLGLTRATRFVNVLEIGVLRNSSNEAPVQRGWEVSLELPLFDWGDARVRRAEAVYMQAVHRAAQTAVDARSEVREAYAHYRYAHEIAQHQFDEVVPLRQHIADENLLRYNGMLIGVFELLADARAQIASVNAALDALRDFWLARADLDMALIGKPALAAAVSPSAPSAAAPAADGGH